MRNAFAVRRGQPASDADGDLDGLAHGQRTVPQAFGERLALEELGDDKMPIGLDADVEEREDIGMRERRHGARLALEARPRSTSPATSAGSTLMATRARAAHPSRDTPRPCRRRREARQSRKGRGAFQQMRGIGDADSRRRNERRHKAFADGFDTI